MVLDRKLQHQILTSLQDVYPDSLLVSALPGYAVDRFFMGNLFYLQEHGLIEGGDLRQPGQCRSMIDAQITKGGLDFLAEDGGLAEILGLLTVKIDTRDIAGVLEAGLLKAELTEGERGEVMAAVSSMSVSQLKELLLILAESGASDKTQLETLFLR